MSRIAIAGAFMLLAAACNGKQPETAAAPAAPVAEAPAAAPAAPPAADPALPAIPAQATGPDMAFAEAMQKFDPSKNHFIWVLPQGIHGKAPWVINVTVKHKGDVKYETKIPLKPEIVPAASYPDFPATAEVIRLTDGGTWKKQMDEVGKVITDIIAKYGRGDGELVMQSDLHTKLDAAGVQTYCVEKKPPMIGVYVEQPAPEGLLRLDVAPMAPFFQAQVTKDCPK